ncbi:9769_t:CDS:2 [Paraglomus occultum]|uniref:9769_t:CDS:1 n=1 Tax=Paraglomus occultum TaxID=144539 RepID=A0A9N8ZE34_9GLOM|nr:9769_t:CDS:2 [Paraglomus occultum]
MLFDDNDLVIEEKALSDVSEFNQNSKEYLSSSKREENDCEEHWPIDLPVYGNINKPRPCYRISSSLNQWSENDKINDDKTTDDKSVHCPLLLQKHADENVPEGYFLRRNWKFPQPYDREWDDNNENKKKKAVHKIPDQFSQFSKKFRHKLLENTPINDFKTENNYLHTDKLQKPLGSSKDSNESNVCKNNRCDNKAEIDRNKSCDRVMQQNMPEGYYLKMRFGDFGYRHRCGYGTDDDDD